MMKDFFKKIMKNKIWLILLIVICVRGIVYSFYHDVSLYWDTYSYVYFDDNIFKGEIDAFRTPIYPNIVKFMALFEKSSALYINIANFQEIISLASVIILYVTLKKNVKNQVVNYFATLAYACLPAIFTYNRIILTESLSISLAVMYFCLIIQYLKNATSGKAVAIAISTFFLIMLRPSFLYLLLVLAIMFLFVFIFEKESRITAIYGSIALVGVIGGILGYSYLNKKQNGYFALSSVTQINQLDNIIALGIFNTRDERDEGIIEIIQDWEDGFKGPWYRKTTEKIMNKYTPEEIDEFLKRCIQNNFSKYCEKTVQRVFNLQFQPCDDIYLKPKDKEVMPPIIYFAFIFIYIIYDSIYILIQTIKNKKIPLVQTILLITILGQLATIIIGAQAEYSRLFMPALPIVFISFAWNMNDILEKKEKVDSKQQEGENRDE